MAKLSQFNWHNRSPTPSFILQYSEGAERVPTCRIAPLFPRKRARQAPSP